MSQKRHDSEVEAIAMQVAMEYEKEEGRQVHDVHEKNLGYDLTSLDLNSGELRLIEVKGIGETTGNVLLTPNKKRVAEDRRDCYWLYVVTDCKSDPKLQNPIKVRKGSALDTGQLNDSFITTLALWKRIRESAFLK